MELLQSMFLDQLEEAYPAMMIVLGSIIGLVLLLTIARYVIRRVAGIGGREDDHMHGGYDMRDAGF